MPVALKLYWVKRAMSHRSPQRARSNRIGHPLAGAAVIGRQNPQRVMAGKIAERISARVQNDGCRLMSAYRERVATPMQQDNPLWSLVTPSRRSRAHP